MAFHNQTHHLFESQYAVLAVVAIAVACALALSKLAFAQDPREPPVLESRIPFIGHMLGTLTGRTEYLGQLGLRKPDTPVHTVRMGVGKVYMISSPQLVQAVFRNKAFSADPLVINFAERMIGIGPNFQHLMRHPPTDGSIPWLKDQHRRYVLLQPGPALNEMNVRVLEGLSAVLNQVGTSFETKILYLWLRDSFSKASAEALFGLDNALVKDPMLNKHLWDYESGQGRLLMSPFPSVLARKPYQARLWLQKTLRAYFRDGCDEKPDVSRIIKERAATNRKWGLPVDDVADHELGMLFVAVTNAIPTMFWMVVYIFRDAQLIADLQDELSKVVTETKGTGPRGRKCAFDIATFSAACPLLNSVYREVMRLTNRNMAPRQSETDVVLNYTPPDGGPDREYLLKKDTPVLIPSMTTNFAEATWGSDPGRFDSRRFMPGPDRERERQQNRALNPFGGGFHLCPGRHFAYAEILGTVAALVLGFEIETPTGGRLAVPAMNNSLVEAVAKPSPEDQQGILARIRRRPGWEDVEWCFVGGSEL